MNIFEYIKNKGKETATQVPVSGTPNDGMNVSGTSNISSARGTPKTTPVTSSTGINTDSSNLAGTNNIKSASGTPKKSVEKPKNDVFIQDSTGKQVRSDEVVSNAKKYQSTLSSVADDSNKRAQQVLNQIATPFNNAKKAIDNYFQDNKERAQDTQAGLTYQRLEQQRQEAKDFDAKERELTLQSITQDDINKFQDEQGNFIDFKTNVSNLEREIQGFKGLLTSDEISDSQKIIIQQQMDNAQLMLDENKDLLKKFTAYSEQSNLDYYQSLGDEETYNSLLDTYSHKNDNFAQRFGTSMGHLVADTINTIPNAIDQVKLTGQTAEATSRIDELNALYQSGQISDQAYGEALMYWNDAIEQYRNDYNDGFSAVMRQGVNQLSANTFYNASDIETFVLQAGESTAQFLLHFAIGNAVANLSMAGAMASEVNAVGGQIATGTMSLASATSKMNQLLEEGYDPETAMKNGILTGMVSYAVEKVGMDRFVDMLGTEVSVNVLGQLIQQNIRAGYSEGLEEVVESLVDSVVDSYTLGKDYEVNGSELLTEFLLGGASGIMMGVGANVGSMINTSIEVNDMLRNNLQNRLNVAGQTGQLKVETREQYNKLQAQAEVLRRWMPSMTEVQKGVANQLVEKANNAMNYFADRSTMMGVEFSYEIVENPTVEQNTQTIYETLTPDFNNEVQVNERLDELQGQIDNDIEQLAVNEINYLNTTQQILNENGYDIDARVFNSLSEEQKNQAMVAHDFAKAFGLNVAIVNNLKPGVNGYVDNGYIVVDGTKRPILFTLTHELTHGTENSKYYPMLKELVKSAYGENWDAEVNKKIEDYKEVQNLDTDGAEREVVARYVEGKLGDEKFIDDLIRYNYSLADRIWQSIKALGDNSETAKIRNTFEKAFADNYAQNDFKLSIIKEKASVNATSSVATPALTDYNLSYDPQNVNYDDKGNELTPGQQEFLSTSIGDRVDPHDPNSPHMQWMHGAPNATFTEFDNKLERNREGENTSQAYYLTSSPKVASSYSGTNKEADPYNIRKTPQTLKELKDILKESNVDVEKVDGEDYIIYGDGLADFLLEDSGMEAYFGMNDDIETVYQNIKTGKIISRDYAYKNDIDVYDESKYRELRAMNTYVGDINQVIDILWTNAFPNRGNYVVYAKSDNPLIIDAQGANWNNLLPPNEVNSLVTDMWTTRDYEQYALDNGYDSIRYLNIVDSGPYAIPKEETDVLVVFSPEQIKSVKNENPTNNPDIRYSADPTNNLSSRLSTIPDTKIDEDLNEMINLAEEQIAFTGELTDQMRGALAQKLYETTYYELEGGNEYTPTDVNRFLRENPIKWSTLRRDNNLSLIEFQKEHPGVKFAKNGGRDWDVIAIEFNEQFPGIIKPEDINSPVDFLNAVQDFKNQLTKYNGTHRVDPENYEQFYEEYDRIMDDFIKENQIKLSKPREMSESRMEQIERQRELFRNSVQDWVRDYDVLREKYNSFDDESFKDAIADVYITGQVTPATIEKLKNSIIKNDFEGYYVDGKADQYIEDFVEEAVDYYILEAEYLVDQKYRDKIAGPANIINQAKSQMYEEDYDRTETALAINELANEVRQRDYTSIYEDVDFIVNNINNKVNVLFNRDLKEYNDLVSGGNKLLRNKLNEVIEDPIRQAQAQELETLQKYKDEFLQLQKETGIKMYSPEDEAIGWMVEGRKQDGSQYDITHLKKDFPNKWEDILKVTNYYKNLMAEWYDLEIAEKQRIYGDEEFANELKTARLENNLESARSILQKRTKDFKDNPNSKTQAGYAKAQNAVEIAEKKLNSQLDKNRKHIEDRKRFTPHRENYFHHTNEVRLSKNVKAFFEMVKKGIGRPNNIPTELAGRTDVTEPRSTNQSYMWRQGKTNYSTSGFASLQHRLHEHANAMAFDSTLSYLRTVQGIIEELDHDNSANNYMTWFRKYINKVAGKTNDLDRVIRDMTTSETTAVLNAINNRAKKNAVYGNISSALVQCGNFPVGMGLSIRNGGPQALQDLVKGTALYLRDLKSENPIKNGSTFLNLRYFDINLNDARFSAKMDKFGDFMMTALDKTTAEQMWYMFYTQGERLGVENPMLYADRMVDRSIQGRRVEDMPLSQQSEFIKLLAPFQAEVNNQWQVMKDLAKGSIKGENKASNFAGLVAITLISAMMNVGFRRVLGRDPLFDPIGAIVNALGDENSTLEETEQKVSARVIGELMGAIPGGQYIPGLLGLSDEEAKNLFGESDPSRYGTGNIGLGPIRKAFFAQSDEERIKALEEILFTYGPEGYGKQLLRFYREGQDFGYVPKYVNGEWRMDPVHYTKSGGVAFVNDPKDVFDYMRGVIGGQYNTKAGREYIDSGFKKLGVESIKDPDGKTIPSSSALQVRKMMEDVGVYDQILEEIEKGNMTPAKAGLNKKVIEMDQEEFNAKYNALSQLAEGIGQQIKEQYNWDEEQTSAFQKALDIEADYNDGKKVTDSEALKTRKALEDAGLYDTVLDYIEKNGLSYSDVGLGKRVVGYDEDKFAEIYAQKIGGGR